MSVPRPFGATRSTAALASLLTLATLLLTALVTNAQATISAPGLRVIGRAVPSNLPPGGEGKIKIYIENLGSTPSNGTVSLTSVLPAGLTAQSAAIQREGEGGERRECETTMTVVTCSLQASIPPGAYGNTSIALAIIKVAVSATPPATGDLHVTVSGGGALAPSSAVVPVSFGSSEARAGIPDFAAWLTNADGTPDVQAGSHPYDLTTAFVLNSVPTGSITERPAGGQARNLNVNLPPGLVGDPQAIPQCPRKALDQGRFEEICPPGSQVGANVATIQGFDLLAAEPVFNMVPPPGVAAQFAFAETGTLVFLNSGVRTGTDNGVTTHVDNLPQAKIVFNTTTIWGVPGDPRHNSERCHAGNGSGEPCPPEGLSRTPLLTLPTSCGAPPEFSAELLSTWQDEHLNAPIARSVMQDQEGDPVGLSGCERLQPFGPLIAIAPDTSYGDTPAGLSVDVRMPQGLNPEGLQTPGLKGTSVVLPEGIAINPGQATGLVACQPSQEALGVLPDGASNEEAPSCPSASKVGTVEMSSPLLRDKLSGNVYILGSNPPHLQLLIAASGDGVNVKLVGDVHLDEQTGQLTTTFENTPDVPFTDFKLSFSGGAQAALATPTRCGAYQSSIDFTPWSSPFIADQLQTSLFQITAGTNGAPCVWPMPFAPTMTAGATTDQAGGYTSFTMLLQRGDEQQRIKSLSFTTPEGLLGMISRVTPCPEPQAAQGTCSAASQIGHTVVGAGPGPYPFYIPQAGAPPAPIYLTGPYKGAPFGLAIVVPLIAGPFNLGTEVVRARLDVDPHTSQVTIVTDPLPVTEKGIPDDLRLIDAVIDRPEFMFNPTDCNPMSFSGTATSTEGATAPLSSHFQMGSCQALKFQPNFKVSTSGRTSRKNGASLTAKIVYPVGNLGANQASGQANIKTVKVNLPKQLPSRLPTLQKACTAKQFETNPAGCPAASIVGHAKAITPVLPVPLEGPAYFVSHGGEAFPNLIVVLQGDNVTVDLVGDTFINEHTNITSSTFKQVPDVPIQSFELNLPEGPYSALAANTNLCKVKGGLHMPTAFTGQNGAVIHQNTPITTAGCTKHKTAKKTKQHRGKRHGRK